MGRGTQVPLHEERCTVFGCKLPAIEQAHTIPGSFAYVCVEHVRPVMTLQDKAGQDMMRVSRKFLMDVVFMQEREAVKPAVLQSFTEVADELIKRLQSMRQTLSANEFEAGMAQLIEALDKERL